MKHSITGWLIFLLISGLVLAGCDGKEKKADIPDVNSILGNISYLDSLLCIRQIDSIAVVNDELSATIDAYRQNIQTADDQAILDSLARISSNAHDFLQFCTDSRKNLELLEIDVNSVEIQHKSGKIQIGPYISALMEAEQVLVTIGNDLSTGYGNTMRNLSNKSLLVNRLFPLPVQGY